MSDSHLPPSQRGPVASISELLEDANRRLDALAATAAPLARGGAHSGARAAHPPPRPPPPPPAAPPAGGGHLSGAREAFGRFTAGLDWHIEVEERLLFPALERGGVSGPTQVMRREHVRIRELLSTCTRTLGGGDVAAFEAALGGLANELQEHNMKEEHVLYPTIDRLAGAALGDLVRQVQNG